VAGEEVGERRVVSAQLIFDVDEDLLLLWA
jgi:hypothetical protein